jgi:hypothetical protein
MRGAGAVLFWLFVAGCGARTGLLEVVDLDGGSADGGSDAASDARPPGDAEPEEGDGPVNHPFACPLDPPAPGAPCRGTALECAYAPSSQPALGLEGFCCIDDGGWASCTIVSEPETCSDIVCSPGTTTECIIARGESCCTCSSDGTADRCGPCER